MVEAKIIESAVKVLVASEIELAGERVAARMCAAFGRLAAAASDSTDVKVNVEKEAGCVIIRIEYESVIRAAAENLENEFPVIDDQMIYSGPEESISSEFNSGVSEHALEPADMEKLADDLAADNALEDAGEELFELQLDPSDIEMLEDDDMSDLRMDDPDSV